MSIFRGPVVGEGTPCAIVSRKFEEDAVQISNVALYVVLRHLNQVLGTTLQVHRLRSELV